MCKQYFCYYDKHQDDQTEDDFNLWKSGQLQRTEVIEYRQLTNSQLDSAEFEECSVFHCKEQLVKKKSPTG